MLGGCSEGLLHAAFRFLFKLQKVYYFCNCTETNCNITNIVIKIFRVFGGLKSRIPCFDGRSYKIEICRVLGVFFSKTRKSDVVTKESVMPSFKQKRHAGGGYTPPVGSQPWSAWRSMVDGRKNVDTSLVCVCV